MTSLWLDPARWHDDTTIGFDDPSGRRADVIVVGAGLAGLATAAHLAADGARVLVLEARSPGAVATGNTTAKLSALQGDRLHRILGLASRDAAQAYVDGTLAGIQALTRTLAWRGASLERMPAVSFAWGEEGEASLAREREAATSLGLEVTAGGGDLLPFETAAALQLDEQVLLQPMTVLAALAAELRANGGAVMQAAVRHVRVQGRGVVVETETGRWRADAAVLATGAPVPARGTSSLLAAQRSYAAAYRTEGPLPRAMALSVDGPSRSVRTARTADGEVLVAGGPGHPVGRHPDPRRLVAELDAWVLRHWPDAVRTHVWSAQDYRTPDRLPWIGARPASRGRVLFATGFDKWGMSGGALAAIALAGRLGGAEPAWARTLRRRGTTPAALGSLAGTAAATVRADLGAWADALAPSARPAEGEGVLGRDGLRLVATSKVDGEMREVSAFCPHIGALVQWNTQERSWDCSAHGSRFAPDGTRLEGPAACGLRGLRRVLTAPVPRRSSARPERERPELGLRARDAEPEGRGLVGERGRGLRAPP